MENDPRTSPPDLGISIIIIIIILDNDDAQRFGNFGSMVGGHE